MLNCHDDCVAFAFIVTTLLWLWKHTEQNREKKIVQLSSEFTLFFIIYVGKVQFQLRTRKWSWERENYKNYERGRSIKGDIIWFNKRKKAWIWTSALADKRSNTRQKPFRSDNWQHLSSPPTSFFYDNGKNRNSGNSAVSSRQTNTIWTLTMSETTHEIPFSIFFYVTRQPKHLWAFMSSQRADPLRWH